MITYQAFFFYKWKRMFKITNIYYSEYHEKTVITSLPAGRES